MSDTPLGQPNGETPKVDYRGLGYGIDKQFSEAAATPTTPPPMLDQQQVQGAMGALGEVENLSPLGSLLDDSEYPDEPGSAGLLGGPGPGPEALGRGGTSRIARVLESLATTTNNPVVASLAAEAAARNL